MTDVGALSLVGGQVFTAAGQGDTRERALPANVHLRGEQIVEVSYVPPPADARVLDVTGMTVLPGMVDLHTHVPVPWSMALYVQQGITSVRFAGTPLGAVPGLRAAGGAYPRLFSCGPLIDAPPAAYPGASVEVRDSAEARATVARLVDAEADALILAQRLQPDVVAAIIEAAHARDVPVTSQTWTTSVRQAVLAGLDGVENTARLPEDPDLPAEWVEGYRSIGHRLARLVALWRSAPQAGIDEVVDLMAERGVDWAPELCSFANWAGLSDAAVEGHPGRALLPPEQRPNLSAGRTQQAEGWTDADRENARAAIERLQRAVSRFHERGGHLCVGTDTHPGALFYALELEYLAGAGLSNAEVLIAATAGGARAMRRSADLGSVEAGKLADLIVVDGDPLRDLAALRRVRHTLVGGRLLVEAGGLVAVAGPA